MNNLSAIVAFVKVATVLNFATAARELGLSRAAVSKSIQRLETSLDVRLFHRDTRSVSLTDEGKVYLDKIRPLMEGINAAADELDKYRTGPYGTVKVSATVGFGRHVILPVISDFLHAYPDIKIDLILEDRHADLVSEQIDIAIRNGALGDQDIISRKLANMQILVCGSPAYFARRGVPTSPDDLAGHDCIGFRSTTTGRLFGWEFEKAGEMLIRPIESRVTVNDVASAIELAIAGQGLVQVGAYQLKEHIRAGRLRPVLTDYLASHRGHHACYASRRQLPVRVRTFLDFLRAKVSDADTCMDREELAQFRALP
ncbi:LysR family transcriptional regulator [Cupriavidus sp. MP-37]|uniref:LysR family transcriptional regulator n=1 Tax=Cupriavidus sp. MP-37 TaxID=2884455 RepID=UPI001D0B3748|nr:LysR family transcriptional regulator [Cupriavidus sp. MP-37]UDM53219.1 LysR family transcriptional regulator [Cupriavidus sp. MP-37]